MTTNDNKISYLTVREMAEKYSFLSNATLRWRIFADKKFKKECVRYFGGKVLLNEANVLKFIEDSVDKPN